jgi:hypothetical protein
MDRFHSTLAIRAQNLTLHPHQLEWTGGRINQRQAMPNTEISTLPARQTMSRFVVATNATRDFYTRE